MRASWIIQVDRRPVIIVVIRDTQVGHMEKRRPCEMEAETEVMGPQNTWSHQKLEEAGTFP